MRVRNRIHLQLCIQQCVVSLQGEVRLCYIGLIHNAGRCTEGYIGLVTICTLGQFLFKMRIYWDSYLAVGLDEREDR